MGLIKLEDYLESQSIKKDGIIEFVLQLGKIIPHLNSENFMDTTITVTASKTLVVQEPEFIATATSMVYKPKLFLCDDANNALGFVNQHYGTNFTSCYQVGRIEYSSGYVEEQLDNDTIISPGNFFILKDLLIGDGDIYVQEDITQEVATRLLALTCPYVGTPTSEPLYLFSRNDFSYELTLKFSAQGSLTTEVEPETIEIDTGNSGGGLT